MDKAKILHEAQTELQRHVWGTYVDKGVSVALGENGIVVPGCEACRKRINTNSQYLQHLLKMFCRGFWSGLCTAKMIRKITTTQITTMFTSTRYRLTVRLCIH